MVIGFFASRRFLGRKHVIDADCVEMGSPSEVVVAEATVVDVEDAAAKKMAADAASSAQAILANPFEASEESEMI